MGLWLAGLQIVAVAMQLWFVWRARRLGRQADAELREYEAEVNQLRQINGVLFNCAVQSFLYQHMPSWLAWQRMTGHSFHMGVGGPGDHADDDSGHT
jgi:hypothetical protein